jgi:hypothetical protein
MGEVMDSIIEIHAWHGRNLSWRVPDPYARGKKYFEHAGSPGRIAGYSLAVAFGSQARGVQWGCSLLMRAFFVFDLW